MNGEPVNRQNRQHSAVGDERMRECLVGPVMEIRWG
jgi:hypothetical protein